MSYNYWGGYEKTQRRAAKDGIKARTSSFGKAWWSRQWIAALGAFGWSNRLSRGRSYARSGQVLDYTIKEGRITAKVQGSRPKPYVVTIALKWLDAPTWERVLDRLAERAEYTARLLNNEMPEDIGEVFASADAALLPTQAKDLTTECSCPDWANPCKHVAAVHYILAEALDGDPFILTALRGRTRDEVLAALRQRRGTAESVAGEKVSETEPLSVDGFWRVRGDLSTLDVGFTPPRVRGGVLRRLGAPGPWTSAEEMVATFGPLMRMASDEVLKAQE